MILVKVDMYEAKMCREVKQIILETNFENGPYVKSAVPTLNLMKGLHGSLEKVNWSDEKADLT